MFNFSTLWCVLLGLSLQIAKAADGLSSRAEGPHIQVELMYEKSAVIPGQSMLLGVLLQPEKDWHTYWQNPGDSGEPPMLNWQVTGVDIGQDIGQNVGQDIDQRLDENPPPDWFTFGDIYGPFLKPFQSLI